jgi:hypothetical protein
MPVFMFHLRHNFNFERYSKYVGEFNYALFRPNITPTLYHGGSNSIQKRDVINTYAFYLKLFWLG